MYYKSNKWLPICDILDYWNLMVPHLKNIKLVAGVSRPRRLILQERRTGR